STAGILDGDIEYILVPGELAYVDGFNVYTNLSNFANTSENVFSGSTYYNYLAGTKFDYSGIHAGVLHQSDDSTFASDSIAVNNYFEDTSGDNAYDYHENDSMDGNWNYAEHEDVTYYGIAYGAKDEMRFGFGYVRNNTSEHDYGNLTQILTSDDLVSGDMLSYQFDHMNAESINVNITQRFELSMYYPVDMMDIGFNAYYGPSLIKNQYNMMDTLYIDRAPAGGPTNYYDSTHTIIEDYQYNSNNWGLNCIVKRDEDDYTGEFMIGYNNSTLGKTDMFSSDSFYYLEEITPVVWGNDTTMVWDSITTMDTLSYQEDLENQLNAGVKYIRKLDKALFGIGAYFYMNNYTRTEVNVYDRNYVEHYNNGNGVDDAADYTTTISGSETRTINFNSVNHNLRLPVGVEFNANKSLVFRLGAVTNFSWLNSERYERITQWEPAMSVTEYGDGSVTETLIDNPGVRSEGQYEQHDFNKDTRYSYGLGWKISDNFSIDLMGFANLTDMTGWQISANAKF
ncbi:MAG: hypothetical protein SVK54_00350, partial [candidate division WOR-3 bacterium]|nr:hypothetical protein [candidate division WOR-3 bacterium]